MRNRNLKVPTPASHAERLAALQAELVEVKLNIEKAKLAKLEAELPDPRVAGYTKYEDFPPPTPEDQRRFRERFEQLYGEIVLEGDDPYDGIVFAPGDGPENYDW